MFYHDIKITYKEFLLLLFGIMLFSVGSYIGIAGELVGGLIFIFFLIKLLNKLCCESVFETDGNLKILPISRGKLVLGKLLILLCYNMAGYGVFLISLFLTGQTDLLEENLLNLTVIGTGITGFREILLGFLLQTVSFTVVGMSLFVLVLLCRFGSIKNSCRRAWTFFIILNLILLPLINKLLIELAGTEYISVMLNGILLCIYIGVILHILKYAGNSKML